jgi:hypothetical protein
MDGISVTYHGESQWVQLKCLGMDEIALDNWQVDEIDSSLGLRVSHCRGMTMFVVYDPGG